MSRIGRRAIAIPSGVSVEQADGEIRVRGPKGALARRLPPAVNMQVTDGELKFDRIEERIPRPRSCDGREHGARRDAGFHA